MGIKGEIRTFEDLEVWKACRNIRRMVFKLTESFPPDEKYRLVDQLRRAAISATANIAEGYGRFHFQENIQFCRQSRGSLYEIIDHLTTSLDTGYLSMDQFEEGRGEVLKGIKLLNGYLKMLQKSKAATEGKPIDD